jgi:shikimate dehydrogenase
MISASTRLCGVIGDPVSHSLSPAMHNAAIAKLSLDYVYLGFHVKPAGLKQAVEGMRALGIAGLNVTIPHKVAVMPFLDEIDPAARDIGAVNTIVNTGGRLKGYNTDAGGFLQSVTAAGFEPQGKQVVLIGAGGAARAIGFSLIQAGANLTILNRKEDFELAVKLADGLNRTAGGHVSALELNPANLKKTLATAGLLVNATSVGMQPGSDATPVPADLLRPGLAVFDAVYAPLETRLLREARERGCTTISGLEMLVRQGGLSFELWTGRKTPLDIMREAALSSLESKKKTSTADTSPKSKPKTGIALIGFMGAGKTSIGKALAKKLGKPLVDTDALIVKKAAKTIARIFKEDGEPSFREIEHEVIAAVSREGGQVIACGGGAVLNPANVRNLKENAVVVYLQTSPSEIQKRVSAGRNKRPLLAGSDGLDRIGTLLASRLPLYETAADIVVNTSKSGIEACAEKVIERLRVYENYRF